MRREEGGESYLISGASSLPKIVLFEKIYHSEIWSRKEVAFIDFSDGRVVVFINGHEYHYWPINWMREG